MNVDSILSLKELCNFKLIAGKLGCSNEVQSVSVLEIPTSQLYVKEGELLISAFYSIKDNKLEQLRTIKMLNKAKASGIILAHVGEIMKKIDKSLISLCNDLNFPLILADSNMPYIDILTPILDNILLSKNTELEEVIRIQELIYSTNITDNNYYNILEKLASILKSDVFFIDVNDYIHSPSNKNISEHTKELISNLRTTNIHTPKQQLISNSDVYQYPIFNNNTYYGSLIVLNKTIFSNTERAAISQVSNLIIKTALTKISNQEYENRLKYDLVNELLFEKKIDEASILKRSEFLKLNIKTFNLLIVIDLINFNKVVNNNTEDSVRKYKNKIVAIIKLNLPLSSRNYIIFQMSDKVIIILRNGEIGSDLKIRQICSTLNHIIRKEISLNCRIGYSENIDSIVDIGSHYEKTVSAINISKKLFPEKLIISYKDMYVFDEFSKLNISKKTSFSSNPLNNLVDYDLKHNSDLTDTLFSIIIYKNNISKTANSMFIHRNTVIQRLNKIIDILGEDPLSEDNYLKYILLILDYKILN